MKQDLISKINDQVITGLESKGLEWFKPFKTGKGNQPMNRVSKKYYTGFNIFILNNLCRAFDYEYNQWMTFKQCSELGGKVKKGGMAVIIIANKKQTRFTSTKLVHLTTKERDL